MHSPLLVRKSSPNLREIKKDSKQDTPQPQPHIRPGPAHESLSALRRRAATRDGRNHPPQPCTPIPVYPPSPCCRRWSRPGSNHSSGSGQGAPRPGRSHPGAELSVPAPYSCPAVAPETEPCRARPHLSRRYSRRRLHLGPLFLFPHRVRLHRPSDFGHWLRWTRPSILIGSGSRLSRQDPRNVGRVPD